MPHKPKRKAGDTARLVRALRKFREIIVMLEARDLTDQQWQQFFSMQQRLERKLNR